MIEYQTNGYNPIIAKDTTETTSIFTLIILNENNPPSEIINNATIQSSEVLNNCPMLFLITPRAEQ